MSAAGLARRDADCSGDAEPEEQREHVDKPETDARRAAGRAHGVTGAEELSVVVVLKMIIPAAT